MNRRRFLANTVSLAALASVAGFARGARAANSYQVAHTAAEWHKLLTPTQYELLLQQGTEAPYTSPLLNEHRKGVFSCVGCGTHKYSSDTKYDSHTGWPSFWAPLPGAVSTVQDASQAIDRTEVHCTVCGGHLGHVFQDGPKPTGLRYCMNGAVLTFAAA